MAPEVIAGNGYTLPADLWSLGCMIFEFIGNGVPFGEELEDPVQVYKAVLHSQLKFPSFLKESSLPCQLIKLLLNRNPGARGSPMDVKQHAWFRQLDWDALHNK
jgi:serine/threonine protein kinase